MNFDLLTINYGIDDTVMQQILALNRNTSSQRLVIIVRTYGGSPFVAYRVMRHLGAMYNHIDIVVPDMAMSAGTLMCMGANTIWMYEGSSLGPLDLQVPHPSDGGQISSLDIRESMYDIFSLTTTITKQLYLQNIDDLTLGKSQASDIAHRSAVDLMKPMVEKIDPFHLHASYRGASIGQKYARLLLLSRMFSGNRAQADITSKILAEDYEMHSYSITMDEASNYLMLDVKPIYELDVLIDIKSFISNSSLGIDFININKSQTVTTTDSKEEE